MEEMVSYSDSEIVEMIENSIVLVLDGESASNLKKKKDKKKEILIYMILKSWLKMQNKGQWKLRIKGPTTLASLWFHNNSISVFAIWINRLMQVENIKTFHDQLPLYLLYFSSWSHLYWKIWSSWMIFFVFMVTLF